MAEVEVRGTRVLGTSQARSEDAKAALSSEAIRPVGAAKQWSGIWAVTAAAEALVIGDVARTVEYARRAVDVCEGIGLYQQLDRLEKVLISVAGSNELEEVAQETGQAILRLEERRLAQSGVIEGTVLGEPT